MIQVALLSFGIFVLVFGLARWEIVQQQDKPLRYWAEEAARTRSLIMGQKNVDINLDGDIIIPHEHMSKHLRSLIRCYEDSIQAYKDVVKRRDDVILHTVGSLVLGLPAVASALVWLLLLFWGQDYLPSSEDCGIVQIVITLIFGGTLAFALTRRHGSDRLVESSGSVPIDIPINRPRTYPSYVRHAAEMVIVIMTITGVLINWKYTLLHGLQIALPVTLFAAVYLALGERWFTGTGYKVRARHIFGPFSHTREFPLYFLLSLLFGCSLTAAFLILSIIV